MMRERGAFYEEAEELRKDGELCPRIIFQNCSIDEVLDAIGQIIIYSINC